jgi:hypothetical protein
VKIVSRSARNGVNSTGSRYTLLRRALELTEYYLFKFRHIEWFSALEDADAAQQGMQILKMKIVSRCMKK